MSSALVVSGSVSQSRIIVALMNRLLASLRYCTLNIIELVLLEFIKRLFLDCQINAKPPGSVHYLPSDNFTELGWVRSGELY